MNCYIANFANTLVFILDATAHGSSPGMCDLIAMTKSDGTSRSGHEMNNDCIHVEHQLTS